jgi:seryl-tRNA synthetase
MLRGTRTEESFVSHDDDGAVPALDHRGLNHHLEVFVTDPMVGAGLPLWLPAGSVIRDELERLAHELARADGCLGVHSPVLAKRGLFERSGHWAKFSEDMFPPMRVGGEELVLRPANCPHHALIYAAVRHSYRELPIRLHELAPPTRRRWWRPEPSTKRSRRPDRVSYLDRVSGRWVRIPRSVRSAGVRGKPAATPDVAE